MIFLIDGLKDNIDLINYPLCMKLEGECVSNFDVLCITDLVK